jgi:hypothetical protein
LDNFDNAEVILTNMLKDKYYLFLNEHEPGGSEVKTKNTNINITLEGNQAGTIKLNKKFVKFIFGNISLLMARCPKDV